MNCFCYLLSFFDFVLILIHTQNNSLCAAAAQIGSAVFECFYLGESEDPENPSTSKVHVAWRNTTISSADIIEAEGKPVKRKTYFGPENQAIEEVYLVRLFNQFKFFLNLYFHYGVVN